jgi:hypothetical protein
MNLSKKLQPPSRQRSAKTHDSPSNKNNNNNTKKNNDSENGKDDDDDDDEEEETDKERLLWDAVKRGTCSFQELTQEWCVRYNTHAQDAMRELLHLIMFACGATSTYVERHDDIHEIDMETLVSAVVHDVQAQANVAAAAATALQYPIMSKAKVR